MSDPHDPPAPIAIGGIVLRLVAVLCVVLAATWGVHQVRDALDLQLLPENEQRLHRTIIAGTLAYIGLLAIPFVPGAEIGLAMITAFGAAIAPLVYGATVLAMALAYLLGCALPSRILARILSSLRLKRAADLIDRACTLPREKRIALLLDRAPAGLAATALHHRYVALMIAVNVPGNSVIGGGGGIMMLAGLSGVFAPLPTLLAVAIAVSPVPLAVLLLGI